jgi:hypothetical protein
MPKCVASFTGRRVIIRMAEMTCRTPQEVMRSPLVADVVQRFLDQLHACNSPLLDIVADWSLDAKDGKPSPAAQTLTEALRLLVEHQPQVIVRLVPRLSPLMEDAQQLADFLETLYDFWREQERFFIYEGSADASRDRAVEGHRAFLQANEELKSLVLDAYRRMEAHLRGSWPRTYRQLPAGANVGLLVDDTKWPCPDGPYAILRDVPFVRLALLQMPVVLYPRHNSGKGQFLPVAENPLAGVKIDPQSWYCLPLCVGPLLIHTFFHEEYLALASSLVNLFEIAGHAEARRKPDGMLVFGVNPEALGDEQIVIHEDAVEDLVIGVIGRSEDVDYFGYFKEMILTLHNVIMMRRGRLPVHGAMCRIELKNGTGANIVIVGESGAGKSESLEAFRVLAEGHLRATTTIFNDMGSLEMTPDGMVVGYGTEIGAYVRLDDLQPGYAFGQIDRSIFMNPHKINARLVIPVTTYRDVMAGLPVDYFLYANNFEQVDDEHGFLQFFADPQQALHVFREGYRAAKGATDERGLVHTYFANPFGPAQFKARHDPLAERYFQAMFDAGVRVGQLRTRLGIPGYEQEGPEAAANALFAAFSQDGLALGSSS